MSLLLIRGALWVASFGVLVVAAGNDLKERIIPNRLVLLVAMGGLALGVTSRPSLVWISILAAVVLVFLLGVLAHFKLLGGGDVKLIAAVSLLVPPDRIGSLLVAIAFVGGLLSLGYLAAYRTLRHVQVTRRGAARSAQTRLNSNQWLDSERARLVGGDSVPYGIAILGGVGVHVASELYQCLFGTSCSL